MPCNLTDLLSVNGYGAFIHIIETHQQIDKCSLSATCRADYRRGRSGTGSECKVLDQRLFFYIREIHMIYIHKSFCGFHQSVFFLHLRFGFDQFKYAVSAGKSVLQFRNYRADIIERLHILVCICQKDRQSSDGKMTRYYRKCTDERHQCIDHIIDRSGRRICQRAEEYCAA